MGSRLLNGSPQLSVRVRFLALVLSLTLTLGTILGTPVIQWTHIRNIHKNVQGNNYKYVCMHTHSYKCMSVCTYVCAYVCTYVTLINVNKPS